MSLTFEQGLPILKNTPTALNALAEELGPEITSANEGENTWSFYDVVGHLIHCEETDWLPRLEIILGNTSNKKFEPFDRYGFIDKSKGLSFEDLLIRFQSRRAHNLDKLRENSTHSNCFAKGRYSPRIWTSNCLATPLCLGSARLKPFESNIARFGESMENVGWPMESIHDHIGG